MKIKNLLLTTLVVVFAFISFNIKAQSNKCATMKILERRMQNDPSIQVRMQQSEIETQKWIAEHPRTNRLKEIITIPVVVHVIWHEEIENISDEQILSQIDILNEDFRLMNSDSLPDTHPFWNYTVDTEIEFCLANSDPDGLETDGITRTYTDSVSFVGEGSEKHTESGGKDNWDPTKYLNLWVCNLGGSDGTLGYAAFPSDLEAEPGEDGVVIRFEAFGDIGTAGSGGFDVNYLGRTATHEVGHWLNLLHIWGDENCGDDEVSDTEVAEDANYGCPTFPHNAENSCGSGEDGEMYMNYMDYVDDDCMNMFTFGQADRMHAALNGDRAGLLTSLGCSPAGVNELFSDNLILLYPNPNNGIFSINFGNYSPMNTTINVFDLLGEKVKTIGNVSNNFIKVDLSELNNGAYFLNISSDNKNITKKVFLTK
jgi:hypothetical protein